jgi:two-component system, NtrC family, sensor kinase
MPKKSKPLKKASAGKITKRAALSKVSRKERTPPRRIPPKAPAPIPIEAQARLAAIVDSSDDAIISKTLEGIVVSWNDGAFRLFGYSAREMIGRSIATLIPEDRRVEEYQILDQIRRGERIQHFETIRLAKAGHLVDVSLTISPIRDANGTIVGASKIMREIGRRKRDEAALRESDR